MRADREPISEADLSRLFDRLFPICRSIAGEGLRESYRIIGDHMPLTLEGVPSGTQVFDWTVPPEWRIRGARLTAPDGSVVADFAASNLNVVNYAEPVDRVLSLDALRPHLHSLPDRPDVVPYVTSYYRRNWGFCLPHRTAAALPAGDYHAWIDSDFVDGEVTFASAELTGETGALVLLTSYLCHPSMANNELSGPLVLLGLYDRIRRWPRRRLTYRFLLNPETMGSLCYLYRYGDDLRQRLVGGLVLTCLGGPQPSLSYKRSRRETAPCDRLAAHLADRQPDHWRLRAFDPSIGSDERQFCSPGFNLPMGQMARTVYGQYDGYHTSGDTKDVMDIAQLMRSIDQIETYLKAFDGNGRYENLAPYGEPQLGRRGLYPSVNSPALWGFSTDDRMDHRRMLTLILYVLNYADGQHDLIDIADKAGCTVGELLAIVARLEEGGLLRRQEEGL